MSKKTLLRGTSADAVLLTVIKLVTVALSFAVTRLLSEHLSVLAYGTYSQVLLIVSTITSLTILGMVDGVNFFFCGQSDEEKRNSYVSTIFCLQCIISGLAGAMVLVLQPVICNGFDNPELGKLLVFAAVIPMFQNLLAMMQVLLVAVGKARVLAARNLVVSIVKLVVVVVVVALVKNVAVILTATALLELGQILLFGFFLRANHCPIRLGSIRLRLSGEILKYCIPMAVFIALNSLNRDCDKYLISVWTNTETLAVYSNASKPLPFDLLIASFTTVLIPKLTRLISGREFDRATSLYRAFLELAYVSTGIMCCAALVVSPQLIQLLYSSKYMSGLGIFAVYILVDLVRFTNITLILSVAGKTKKLMLVATGAVIGNLALNMVLFRLFGVIGPAVATLVTTLITGVLILSFGAKELRTGLLRLFDWKYFALFAAESLAAFAALYPLQRWMSQQGIGYLLIMLVVGGAYAGILLMLNGKRFLRTLRNINRMSK